MAGMNRTGGRRGARTALIAGLVFLAACDMEVSGPIPVLNRRMGFYITPPEDWKVQLDKDRMKPVELTSKDLTAKVEVMLIAAEEGDTAKEVFLSEYAANDPNIVVREQGEVDLAGRKAYRGVIFHDLFEGNILLLRYVMADGPRFYDIRCTCPESDFPGRRDVFEGIVKSFRFKPKE